MLEFLIKKSASKMKTPARFYFDVFLALLVNTFVVIKQNNQKFVSWQFSISIQQEVEASI